MLKTLDLEIYHGLFAGAKLGMFLVEGEHGVIVDVNARAAGLLGATGDEVVGRAFVDVFPPDLRPRIADTLDDLWNAEGVRGYGTRLLGRGGADVPVRLDTCVVVHDDLAYLAVWIHPSEVVAAAGPRRTGAERSRAGDEADRNAEAARRADRIRRRLAVERGHALHILLAEDNKVNQTVALGMMRKLGHDGTAVDDGRHALMTLASGDFDVVFMDLQMPELGGLETTRRIRAGEAGDRYREIPIVAMTGHATRQDRQACLAAGMNGYIAKPISSERITEAIEHLASGAVDGGSGNAPFSAERLITQMNGDTELAAEILGVFREDTTVRLDRIAVSLRNYAFEGVVQEARAIEGGALNVCAETMVSLSRDLLRAAERKEHELAVSLADDMAAEVRTMTIDRS